jgi:uncharacterized protein YgiM (DUF1202 family)
MIPKEEKSMTKLCSAFLFAVVLMAGSATYAAESGTATDHSESLVPSSAFLLMESGPADPIPYQGFVCVVRTQGGRLNIRSIPSTSGRIVGKLGNGTVVRELGVRDGWSRIAVSTSSGRVGRVLGWVLSDYLLCGE